jgi:cytochrome c551/c552
MCSRTAGAAGLLLLVAPIWAQYDVAVSFSRDVRPIIQRSCQGCHQPASKMGGLDLTTHAALLAGGAKGAAVVPGDPAGSLLIAYVSGEKKPSMPMGQDLLPDEQLATLRGWVAGGAIDDTPEELFDPAAATEPPLYTHAPVINALAFSPDGKTLAVAGYREVLLHKVDGGLEARLVGLSEKIQSLEFSRDGKLLLAAGGSPARFGEVQIWDAAKRELIRSLSACEDTVFGASLSSDGKLFAFGCPDQTVRIHELASGKELQKASYHENWVLDTVFSVDGTKVVSVGRDSAARVADVASGSFLETVNKLRGELTAIARHPTRDQVLIGGLDRTPYYYRMQRSRKMQIADDSTLIRELEMQQGEIFALAIHPDGNSAIVAGSSPEAPIYDLETGRRRATCKGHDAGLYAVAFSPDGKQVATAGFDGMVRVYDTAGGKLLREFVPVPLEGTSSEE